MLKYKISPLTHAIFNTILEVRIYDVNYGNHLGHDSLISLIHEARVRFFKSFGYSESNIHGLGILITNLVVNYLSEAFYSDKIIINIGIDNISKTSMDLVYEVKNVETNKDIGRAVTTVTFYHYEQRKVCRVPREFLNQLDELKITP